MREVRITVVVDSYRGEYSYRLGSGWGLSLLVEANGQVVLFDTGPRPALLEHNLRMLDVKPSRIDTVIISHEHYDHVGGLEYLASASPGATVYVPAGSTGEFKRWVSGLGLQVMEVRETTRIGESVYVVGELGTEWGLFEQAAAVRLGEGMILLLGCAHPGPEIVMSKAMDDLGLNLYAVVGGMHMVGADERRLEILARFLERHDVSVVAPLHCTGEEARRFLSERLPHRTMLLHVGSVLELHGV